MSSHSSQSPEGKSRLSKSTLLLMLCWVVYTCSYIGKLSYSANINIIGTQFGVNYTDTGTVTTFFFFAYGIGQVVNGIFVKKYNIKFVVFASLIVASAMNVLIINAPDVGLMKYFWMINGAAMSFLWTALIRLLSETLKKEDRNRAILVMGTTVATGTFLVYGISSLFAAFLDFRLVFYVAAGIMTAVALVWIFSCDSLAKPLRSELELENEIKASSAPLAESAPKKRLNMLPFFAVLALFAVANNFTKDGLTSWTPDILDSIYHTPDWMSIMLTLLLPLLSIGGAWVALNLNKKINSFIGSCAILFGGSALLILAVIFCIQTPAIPVTVGCFAVVCCLMAGVNNIITSMVPLQIKSNNSGRIAGLLNGFCYLGSTLTSYTLGAIADSFNWLTVFFVLLAVCAAVAVIGVVYALITRLCKGRAI